MKIYTVPEAQQTILKRRPWDEIEIPQSLIDGIQAVFGEHLTPEEVVRRILSDVRQRGDDAIFVKIVSVIGLNEEALQAIGPAAEIIARAEGLNGHAETVARRLRSPEVG